MHGPAWRTPEALPAESATGRAPDPADRPGRPQSFLLPDLGEGLADGQIVQWLVGPGDIVETDQSVVEVETAKAVTELPSPYAGRVRELCAGVGETVAVGHPLLTIEPLDTAVRPAPRGETDEVPGPRPPERALVGFGTSPGTEDGPASADLRIPLDGMRGAVARKTVVSRSEIPDVTVWLDVDVTALVEARAAARKSASRLPSLTAVLAYHAVDALRRYPALNARVDTVGDCVVQLAEIALGVTVQTGRGLLVPVVRGAGRLDAREVADEADRVVKATLDGALTDVAVGQGTFTVNNYGALGVDGATPVINHPEAAMLGMGRIIDRPWAVDGRVVIRNVTTLSVTFDHRVCDGDVASGFLRGVAGLLEAGRLPGDPPGE
ncbi:2-oxo acid dehydrogenase subunit E2 [Streptomyces sp. NBC_00441]|nr:dihydrolipoamide acetyltransferase family protein [Streptomyces sp. NBC_00441]